MRTLIRWCAVAVLLMLTALPVFAQDTAAALKPYTDKASGFSSVIPDGWKDIGRGLFQRLKTPADVTLIAQQSAALAPDKLLAALLPQLQLTTVPESVGGYKSAVLEWTLYKVDVKVPTVTIIVDLALAPDPASGKTFIVLMQTTSEDYDALHKDVFQPVLEAFTPYVESVASDAPYTEEEVTVTNGDVTLSGTLTLPKTDGPHPAMVLITGSGPQDRDETIGQLRPFRLIADALAAKGVAVLRYDDRGTGKSTGNFDAATTADFASDATAAIDFLLTRDDIDHAKVGALGHSEGGMVTAMLGATNPHVAFIVSMAGPAVSGADVLIQQNKRIMEAEGTPADAIKIQLDFLPKLFALVDKNDTEGIRKLTYDTFIAAEKLMPEEQRKAITDYKAYAQQQADSTATSYNTDWWRFMLKYDAGTDWAKTKVPVLAIFGTLDVQVDADQNAPAFEAAMKNAGNTDYQVTILPTANHLMQAATTGSPSEYATLKQEFTPDFLPTIIDWLTAHDIITAA